MSELLTAAQMRAIEKTAIESGVVTGLELMERAGRGVVEAIYEQWPEIFEARDAAKGGAAPRPAASPRDICKKMKHAVVLCGPGNNGGDGFVVARLLQARGWAVSTYIYGDPEQLPTDARVNYDRWRELGSVADVTEFDPQQDCDCLVDALFGTGLSRGLPDLGALFAQIGERADGALVEAAPTSGCPAIVAVDVPSGLCADSGRVFPLGDGPLRSALRAHLTVSFHRLKLGHVLADGPTLCGKVVVKDIGLEANATVKTAELAAPSLQELRKDRGHHKFNHGHALVLTGGFGRTGAARLAARSALRVGAGLVTLGVPPAAQMEVASQITGLMMARVDGGAALADLLQDPRITALCLGPGLGLERARDLVPFALADPSRAAVLDADALSAFAAQPRALFDSLHTGCVLTPHAGEFARLFPDLAARLAQRPARGPISSKVDATREAAARAGCTVLYKGADTVIATPQGDCAIHLAAYERKAPWLATAGAGDVLAGLITGLLARGLGPYAAAQTAAWLHVESARSFGPGLIAEDLPDHLPHILAELDL
ncbi:NAD(P)H-hydrate dehydratase [Phaeobacter sp. HF9A]|uniref:NAD(P)H-hydrate dehydratase n=1 Tax=Phaeobacter sp. HF9A TaxID=2721561 RepID=UPI0014304DB0|nr:NAD(P)H-hydrate dehydratase [Phaeobacter sp. HF9A]NIZ15562.1 NAD(P)H-hydrate dehydratase [Phaeobacter sp. HF9A]